MGGFVRLVADFLRPLIGVSILVGSIWLWNKYYAWRLSGRQKEAKKLAWGALLPWTAILAAFVFLISNGQELPSRGDFGPALDIAGYLALVVSIWLWSEYYVYWLLRHYKEDKRKTMWRTLVPVIGILTVAALLAIAIVSGHAPQKWRSLGISPTDAALSVLWAGGRLVLECIFAILLIGWEGSNWLVCIGTPDARCPPPTAIAHHLSHIGAHYLPTWVATIVSIGYFLLVLFTTGRWPFRWPRL